MNMKERRASISKLISATVSFGIAALATGAFAVPAANAAGGQSCTGQGNPVITTASPLYNVENTNSAGGSACVTVSASAEAFHVDSTNFDPSAPGADTSTPYIGFKAIYTGCKNKACLEPEYPALAGSIVSEPTSWTFSSNFSQINGQFDAIYDAFFNTTPSQQYLPTGGELEVFLNYTSQESALGGTQLPDLTVAGQTYHVWSVVKTAGARTWTRIAFQRASTNRTTSVSNLDMATFIKAAIADGSINPSWYQQDLEAGFEIWQGGVGLATSAFSAPDPTVAANSGSGGSGGSGSNNGGGTGSGSTGGGGSTGTGSSGSAGGASATKSTGATSAKKAKPHVSLAMPACSTKQSRAKCNAFRRTAGAWRYAYGFASGENKLTKVMVTAFRYKQKNAKARTIKLKARFIGPTDWKVHLGTLTKGRWRFTAVVTDKAGHTATSNAVLENINIGLDADAPIPHSAAK
jgi:glycosyl hydrolase family 12